MKQNEKVIAKIMNNIIRKDMEHIGYIEVMNGNVNFK